MCNKIDFEGTTDSLTLTYTVARTPALWAGGRCHDNGRHGKIERVHQPPQFSVASPLLYKFKFDLWGNDQMKRYKHEKKIDQPISEE